MRMTARQRMRAGLGLFLCLTLVLSINVFHLQPLEGRSAAVRSQALDAMETSALAGSRSDGGSGERLTIGGPETLALEAPAAPPRPEAAIAMARSVHRELELKGYEAGAGDGGVDIVLRASIMAFEWDHGQALTGLPSESLLQGLIMGAGHGGAPGSSTAPPGPEAEQVIRTVQRTLALLGHPHIKADGRLGQETRRAIRSFEARQRMKETGRISGELAERLIALAGQGRLADNR